MLISLVLEDDGEDDSLAALYQVGAGRGGTDGTNGCAAVWLGDERNPWIKYALS